MDDWALQTKTDLISVKNHCRVIQTRNGSYSWNFFQDDYQLCGSGGKTVTHQSVSGLTPGPCSLHVEVSFGKIPKILVRYCSWWPGCALPPSATSVWMNVCHTVCMLTCVVKCFEWLLRIQKCYVNIIYFYCQWKDKYSWLYCFN